MEPAKRRFTMRKRSSAMGGASTRPVSSAVSWGEPQGFAVSSESSLNPTVIVPVRQQHAGAGAGAGSSEKPCQWAHH